MFCPYCQSEETKVVDKRDNSDTKVTRRRRECITCSKRFTTYERVETIQLNVEKRDGRIVDYNKNQLKSSVMKAVKKGILEEKQIEELIDGIELKILNRKSTVVKSKDIGDMVLTRLKKIDAVSYLRFASVYRDIDSIEKFKAELKSLEN